MSGLLPPRSSKDLGRCLTLPAAVRRLIVVIGVICSSVWRAMSATRTPGALVLDVESCNQLAGFPGCGLNHTRPRAYGGGGDRRALGRGPGADPVAQTPLDMPRTHLPDRDLHREEPLGVRTPGAFGDPGDPLGDPTVTLRRGHYRWLGSTTGNHVEHRVVPYQAVSASRI